MTEPNDLDARLLAQMKEDFLVESGEILDRLGPLLTEWEADGDADLINAILRDVHTLKGTAGFVGLESIRRLAHKLEDVFGALRAEQLTVTPELVDLALAGLQQLTTMREDVASGGTGEADIAPLVARLEAAQQGEALEGGVPLGEAAPARAASTLRVDLAALDNIMVLVGELITARNALLALAEQLEDEALADNAEAISRLTRQLQTAVNAVRLVPVERLFTRFVPIVRNMARERGKQVRLVIEGGDTPVDRTVSEQMYEPLIHLLRNAVDHGLEPTPDRRRAHKGEEGTLRLSAERRGDDVILRIADDGRGIDPNRVRQVAVERGTLSAEEAAELSDKQAIRLIFEPGFSTAGQVTDVSGRGVGLDVVRQSVRRLRGSVDIETVAGEGTAIVIQLPLTLAILQVLLVRMGTYTYALPLHVVRETLQLSLHAIQTMQQGEVIFVRDVALPVRRLHDMVMDGRAQGAEEQIRNPQSATRNPQSAIRNGTQPAVVIHLMSGDEVWVVDELVGKQQVVVKALSPYLGAVRGAEGAAILPDGSVTLILDVEQLVSSAFHTTSR